VTGQNWRLQVPKLSETINLREVQSRSLPVVLHERLHYGARAVLRYNAQFGSFDVAVSHVATWRRGTLQRGVMACRSRKATCHLHCAICSIPHAILDCSAPKPPHFHFSGGGFSGGCASFMRACERVHVCVSACSACARRAHVLASPVRVNCASIACITKPAELCPGWLLTACQANPRCTMVHFRARARLACTTLWVGL
jgi:hypothetical protein